MALSTHRQRSRATKTTKGRKAPSRRSRTRLRQSCPPTRPRWSTRRPWSSASRSPHQPKARPRIRQARSRHANPRPRARQRSPHPRPQPCLRDIPRTRPSKPRRRPCPTRRTALRRGPARSARGWRLRRPRHPSWRRPRLHSATTRSLPLRPSHSRHKRSHPTKNQSSKNQSSSKRRLACELLRQRQVQPAHSRPRIPSTGRHLWRILPSRPRLLSQHHPRRPARSQLHSRLPHGFRSLPRSLRHPAQTHRWALERLRSKPPRHAHRKLPPTPRQGLGHSLAQSRPRRPKPRNSLARSSRRPPRSSPPSPRPARMVPHERAPPTRRQCQRPRTSLTRSSKQALLPSPHRQRREIASSAGKRNLRCRAPTRIVARLPPRHPGLPSPGPAPQLSHRRRAHLPKRRRMPPRRHRQASRPSRPRARKSPKRRRRDAHARSARAPPGPTRTHLLRESLRARIPNRQARFGLRRRSRRMEPSQPLHLKCSPSNPPGRNQ